jgi:hypothetical protein
MIYNFQVRKWRKRMKVYISGSIYGGRQKVDTYRKLISKLEEFAEVLNKNIIDDDVIEKEAFQSDYDIFKDLENKMKESDVILAEVTVPSLGVGYEIGFSDMIGKKVVAIYDANDIEKVSTMIRGNERIKLIAYKDLSDILDNLETIIKE